MKQPPRSIVEGRLSTLILVLAIVCQTSFTQKMDDMWKLEHQHPFLIRYWLQSPHSTPCIVLFSHTNILPPALFPYHRKAAQGLNHLNHVGNRLIGIP
ncbi:uncharacterized protein BDR25DRAFT_80861 [Lindgomyces ingoldianus]|uniref:Uncharacterized protein n=1 Tax=Lindgomyces ingoldianus TaxID=673940 RepID=A0ACB6QFZ3_9PLEO|nr:uncharacterized protein BDR25DRAFT_80861 [Lindgomyces ingoldianus]KAF2465898.1 hypothetical protein BDR25DRAFT_80861 [Lindgomyces ingoldianus]